MMDEVFYYKFGKIWVDCMILYLMEEESNIIEDWVVECFQMFLFNFVNLEQMKVVYDMFDFDYKWVMEEMVEIFGDDGK